MPKKARALKTGTDTPGLGIGSSWPTLERMARVDRALQNEINLALGSLLANRPSLVDLRLVRMLTALLVPSWTEHTSFQNEVMFPIIMRNGGEDAVAALLARLRVEHVDITRLQARLVVDFERVISGRLGDHAAYRDRLRVLLEVRRHHLKAEAQLTGLLPSVLAAADETTIQIWASTRPVPPFPISVLRFTRLH